MKMLRNKKVLSLFLIAVTMLYQVPAFAVAETRQIQVAGPSAPTKLAELPADQTNSPQPSAQPFNTSLDPASPLSRPSGEEQPTPADPSAPVPDMGNPAEMKELGDALESWRIRHDNLSMFLAELEQSQHDAQRRIQKTNRVINRLEDLLTKIAAAPATPGMTSISQEEYNGWVNEKNNAKANFNVAKNDLVDFLASKIAFIKGEIAIADQKMNDIRNAMTNAQRGEAFDANLKTKAPSFDAASDRQTLNIKRAAFDGAIEEVKAIASKVLQRVWDVVGQYMMAGATLTGPQRAVIRAARRLARALQEL